MCGDTILSNYGGNYAKLILKNGILLSSSKPNSKKVSPRHNEVKMLKTKKHKVLNRTKHTHTNTHYLCIVVKSFMTVSSSKMEVFIIKMYDSMKTNCENQKKIKM
jgi:hypothetical protein